MGIKDFFKSFTHETALIGYTSVSGDELMDSLLKLKDKYSPNPKPDERKRTIEMVTHLIDFMAYHKPNRQ